MANITDDMETKYPIDVNEVISELIALIKDLDERLKKLE